MEMMLAVAELFGFLLAAYGVLRESFADLARATAAYGEDRYGEGTYSGPSRMVRRIVGVGVVLRLLPRDEQLTLTDRQKNAAIAIAGVVIAGVALVLDLLI